MATNLESGLKSTKLNMMLDNYAPDANARIHYMPKEKDSILDPQALLQRVPWVYSFIKSWISATFPQGDWSEHMPDPSQGTVINLGCGATQLHPEMVNVDFVKFPHVDIVADFSKPLPIRSGSVDGIVSISVLEHVREIGFLISEITRVLKPGGKVYLAIPFLYPFHGAPSDFYRWTLPGIQALLGDSFEVVSSGNRGGPFGVMILSVSHAMAQILSLGSLRIYSLVNFSMMGLLSPVKFLDGLMSLFPFHNVLSPGIYVAARKR